MTRFRDSHTDQSCPQKMPRTIRRGPRRRPNQLQKAKGGRDLNRPCGANFIICINLESSIAIRSAFHILTTPWGDRMPRVLEQI